MALRARETAGAVQQEQFSATSLRRSARNVSNGVTGVAPRRGTRETENWEKLSLLDRAKFSLAPATLSTQTSVHLCTMCGRRTTQLATLAAAVEARTLPGNGVADEVEREVDSCCITVWNPGENELA